MSKYKYAVELYSVKDALAADLLGTLKAVKTMGYEGVEFAGLFVHTAEEVKQALDEAGLVCCGWHTPWDYLSERNFYATVSYFQAIGNANVIIPGLPRDMTDSKEKWLETAALFNDRAKKLAPYGMRIGYHNHDSELPLYPDGSCDFTTFFDATCPEVIVQMDNGHVVNGRGFDMIELLHRYPNRYKTVHLKPYSLEKGKDDPQLGYHTMIGEDDVPWGDFMRITRESGGTEWYIVEYECAELYPELVGVEKCLTILREMEAQGAL